MRPELTGGLLLSIGAKLWLNFDPQAERRPSLACGSAGVVLADRYGWSHRTGLVGASCAFEVRF